MDKLIEAYTELLFELLIRDPDLRKPEFSIRRAIARMCAETLGRDFEMDFSEIKFQEQQGAAA